MFRPIDPPQSRPYPEGSSISSPPSAMEQYRAGDFPAQPLQHLRVGRDLRGILAAQPRTEILAALSFSDTVGFVVHNGPLAAAPYGKVDHLGGQSFFPAKGSSAEMLVKMAEQRTVAVGLAKRERQLGIARRPSERAAESCRPRKTRRLRRLFRRQTQRAHTHRRSLSRQAPCPTLFLRGAVQQHGGGRLPRILLPAPRANDRRAAPPAPSRCERSYPNGRRMASPPYFLRSVLQYCRSGGRAIFCIRCPIRARRHTRHDPVLRA